MDSEEIEINDRSEKFCNEYLVDLNGTQAVIRAGYSENGAAVQAHRLLRNAKIQKRIAELRKQMSLTFDVTKERVLQELALVAFGDTQHIFDENGKLKPPNEWTFEGKVISGYEETVTEFGEGERAGTKISKKVKQWDKLKAIELFSKILGHYAPEKHSLTDPDGNPVTLFQLPDNGRGKTEAS